MDSDKEDGWPCPICTYRNASYRRRCEMCYSRPSGQSPTDQEDIDDAEEEPSNGGKWSYTDFTYPNPSGGSRREFVNEPNKHTDDSFTFPDMDQKLGEIDLDSVREPIDVAYKDSPNRNELSDTGMTYPNPSGSSRREFVSEPNKHTDDSFTFPDMDQKLGEIDLDSVREPIDVAYKDSPNRNDWSCSVCTFLNPASRWKCGMCGKGRKSTIESSTFQDSDQTMRENYSDFDWICTSCTLVNTAGSWRCRACHKRRKPTYEPAAFNEIDQRKRNFRFESELENKIRIVLIGKSGCGKSATGNTILGQEAFKSVSSFSSVTQKCSSGSNNRFEKKLLVVDTPGLFDTGMTDEIITKEIVKCIGMTSPGPHAIVLVVAVGRFTKEDQDTVQQFSDIFGEGIFNHMIVLFTRRDDLERKNETIQSCVQNAAPAFKEIIRKCHQRYLAFDNNQAPAMREKDAMTLIQMIHDITQSNGGKCYSNEMYEEAEKQYRRRVEEIERQKQREKEFEKEQITQLLKNEFRNEMGKSKKDKQRLLEQYREIEQKMHSYQYESMETLAKLKEHKQLTRNRNMDERERNIKEKELALKEEETKQRQRDQEREIKRLQKECEDKLRRAEEREWQYKAEHRRKEQELLEQIERKHKMDSDNTRSQIRKELEDENKGAISSLWDGIKDVATGVKKGIVGVGNAAVRFLFK